MEARPNWNLFATVGLQRDRNVRCVLRSATRDPDTEWSSGLETMLLKSVQPICLFVPHEGRAWKERVSEAEADARRALLSVLQNQGKYHPATPKYIIGLASVLVDQGRYASNLLGDRTAVQRGLQFGHV